MRGRPPNTLEDLGMQAIKLQRLTSARRGMPPGEERERLTALINSVRRTLNSAIWSWRRRNEAPDA
jgi:hypothetical protein